MQDNFHESSIKYRYRYIEQYACDFRETRLNVYEFVQMVLVRD